MHARSLTGMLLVLFAVGCGGNGAYSGKSTDAADAAPGHDAPKAAIAAGDATSAADAGSTTDVVDDDRVAGPPVCPITPRTPPGAGYRSGAPERADLAADAPGVPLTVQIKVADVTACDPLEGVSVSLWQPDAHGATDNDIRGIQIASSFGVVTFQTIYPGGTDIRAPHLSVKVTAGADELYEGQLFFPDAITDRVYESDAYVGSVAAAADEPNLVALDDPQRLMLDVTPMGRDAFIASFTLGVESP